MVHPPGKGGHEDSGWVTLHNFGKVGFQMSQLRSKTDKTDSKIELSVQNYVDPHVFRPSRIQHLDFPNSVTHFATAGWPAGRLKYGRHTVMCNLRLQ